MNHRTHFKKSQAFCGRYLPASSPDLRFAKDASCSPSEPEFIDPGQPGQIKVIALNDANRNGTWDSGETGLPEQVGIPKDVTSPAESRELATFLTPDSNRDAHFDHFDRGKYCVSCQGDMLPTSKLAFEGLLSSDQELTAYFGLTENQGSSCLDQAVRAVMAMDKISVQWPPTFIVILDEFQC